MNLPPVFVISLVRAKERRAHIAEQLASVPYEIVDAVDGTTLNMDALSAEGRLRQDKSKKLYGRVLMPGEVGCYLSHYALWERIAAQPQDCALVLEDDVELADDFFDVVADIVNSPWHWEVVNLATAKVMPIKKSMHPVGNGRKFGLSPHGGGCAAAYLIRPSGAQKLLSFCREMREPMDMLYVRWWRHGAVYYFVSPPAAKQIPRLVSAIGERDDKNRAFIDSISSSINRKRERFARKWAVLNHRPRRR